MRLNFMEKGRVHMKKICVLTLIAMMVLGMCTVSIAEAPQIKLHAITTSTRTIWTAATGSPPWKFRRRWTNTATATLP